MLRVSTSFRVLAHIKKNLSTCCRSLLIVCTLHVSSFPCCPTSSNPLFCRLRDTPCMLPDLPTTKSVDLITPRTLDFDLLQFPFRRVVFVSDYSAATRMQLVLHVHPQKYLWTEPKKLFPWHHASPLLTNIPTKSGNVAALI